MSVGSSGLVIDKPLSYRSPKRVINGLEPLVLADIYENDVNMVVWERVLQKPLVSVVDQLLVAKKGLQISMTVSPDQVFSALEKEFGAGLYSAVSESIAELVDMFCYLFGLKRAGLRLTALDRAMCPKFHVDKVPCRLVTTFQGVATEWLPDGEADRSKLGLGSGGQPDHLSGIYRRRDSVKSLECGHVALLKGENWEGNEGGGLIHRSPSLVPNTQRLLMTLDFSD